MIRFFSRLSSGQQRKGKERDWHEMRRRGFPMSIPWGQDGGTWVLFLENPTDNSAAGRPKSGTQGELSSVAAWSRLEYVSQRGLPGGSVLTEWPRGFPQDVGPPLALPDPSGFPGCAPHTPLSSAGPSAAGSQPAQQLPHPQADSRTACKVSNRRAVRSRGKDKVAGGEGWGPTGWRWCCARAREAPDGVLCALP